MSEMNRDDEQWAAQAGLQLRSVEGDLPETVAEDLRRARQRAVNLADKAPRSDRFRFWPQLGGFGVLTAAVFFVVVLLGSPVDTLPNLGVEEMAAVQEVELLEDMEFLAWLVEMDSQPDNAVETSGKG